MNNQTVIVPGLSILYYFSIKVFEIHFEIFQTSNSLFKIQSKKNNDATKINYLAANWCFFKILFAIFTIGGQ